MPCSDGQTGDAVEATTDEYKAALRLLDVRPPLGGTVVTAVAMFSRADVALEAAAEGR